MSGFVRTPVSDWGLENSLSGCHQHTVSAFLLLLLSLGCPDAPWVGPRLKCAFPLLEGALAIGADSGGGLSMGTPPADPWGCQGEDAPCSSTAPAQSFSSDFTACCKIHSSTPGPHLRRASWQPQPSGRPQPSCVERHGQENWALCVAEPSGRGEAQNAVSVPGSAPAARAAPVASSCCPCQKLLQLPAAST